MRTAHWKAHLLPLLLLSLHSVSVCLAVSCAFDEFVAKNGQLNIATAAKQSTGQDWEPLRILASTKDLDGKPRYCIKEKDGSIHDRSTKSADSECEEFLDTVTAAQKITFMGILEKAITLHADRLLVQRAVGPLKIPDFSTHEFCKHFNVPAEHHTPGVANADIVLYVGSVRTLFVGKGDSAAVSMTCAKSAGGRPIAGVLVFGNGNDEISRSTVRLAAHQIAHALGFSYDEMKLRNMIVDKNVRSKPKAVAVVKSEKTKKMTQEHYGCPTAEGMELEDGEENNEKLSHWERRNAKDELMAKPVIDLGNLFMGFYTNLTMAAFEDMGYYKANFQMAEHMEYGYKAKCEFLTDKCMDKGVTKWPHMFCDVRESKGIADDCTTDRLGLGHCVLKNDYNSSLPEYFQYFESPNKGGFSFSFTDYCPVVEQHSSFDCRKLERMWSAPGSLFSENSMCLYGNALEAELSGSAISVGGVCAEISCEGGAVKVKYDGDKNWHDCPKGQTLTPSSTSKSFVSGEIKCPKYEEVCTVAPDGSSLVPKVIYKPMEPSTSKSPTASQNPTASQDPTASDKPTGKPNDPNSGGKSKDGSSVPFGLIPSVAFLVVSFAGYLIA